MTGRGSLRIALSAVLLLYMVSTDFLEKTFTYLDDLDGRVVTKVAWMTYHMTYFMECGAMCVLESQCVFVAFNSLSSQCKAYRRDNTTWPTESALDSQWKHLKLNNFEIHFFHQSDGCDTGGYVTIEGGCFKVHDENRTYAEASTTCSAEGGRMAVLDVQDTFMALNDYIRSNYVYMLGYFLGLTDIEEEGQWRWANGNLIGQHPEFNRDQPNDNDRRYNGHGADCGFISVVKHNMHKAIDRLYDDACHHQISFVCERVLP